MMSPNGRRAWRRWMRRVEHNPKLRPPGKSISRLAREGKRHLGSIPPTPPKPFTARSLVGMTMGARKRRSRAVSYLVIVDVTFIEHAETWANTDHSKLFRQRKFPRHQWDLEQYNQVRAQYRIGERLRPCPGCPECDHGKGWRCDNCGTTKGLCDLTLAEVRCKCGKGCGQWRISFPATTVCDGSGVLPAKRQLCLGCSWCGTPPKEGATRFTECDGSGVLPARRS